MQQEFFADIVGPGRVYYVPHGIDVEYFRPADHVDGRDGEFRCLFVGSHLRDLDTLAGAARRLGARTDICFTAVTRPANHAKFAGLANVDTRSGLDDAQLLALYQHADLLVLPLLEATANNSLLEALACGLPIVSTDLQGARDYVDAECAILTQKGDAARLADAILELERDRDRRRRMALASRRRALEFRWEAVAARMSEVYRRAAQGG